MARTIAYVFGAILVLAGIWGFVQNPVLGIFDANMLHSIVHIATGVILLGAALWMQNLLMLALKIFGIVYALIAILGFVMGGDMIFGLIDNSLADNILHTILAVVFLWAGFMSSEGESDPMQPTM